MASQRPGFARRDTDNVSMQRSEVVPKLSMSKDDEKSDEKQVPIVEVTDDNADLQKPDHGDFAPPEYLGENDGFNYITKPVETAKDLTTQVLHVQDDPTLSPYTFRLFFLGEQCYFCNQSYNADTLQDVDSLSSARCFRRSSTSSRKQSSFPSSS